MKLMKKFKMGFAAGVVIGLMLFLLEIMFEYDNVSMTYENKVTKYTLTGTFGRYKYAYRGLVTRLNNAKRGDRIVIYIINHKGGVNYTREYISNAILRSKAYVEIHVHGLAASNAALLFRYGNVAVVEKGSRILYHQSFSRSKWGKREYPAYLYRWSIREHNRVSAFIFMTKAEKRKWYQRKDVVIRGTRICKSRFLLTDMNNSCVIRGIK